VSKCVVITGSIGCGKSSVCKILSQKGYKIIDADLISKKIAKDSIDDIATAFGGEFLIGKEIDAKKLGKLIFSNKQEKEKLESIMHPKIKKEIFKQIEILGKEGELFFVDIPLFFESQNYKELKPVAVVYAPKEAQLERIISRDSFSVADANDRIGSQMNIEEKKEKADFVIDNSGEASTLEAEVDNFLKEVEQWFYKNTAQAETTF